jgi:hypothetical protein
LIVEFSTDLSQSADTRYIIGRGATRRILPQVLAPPAPSLPFAGGSRATIRSLRSPTCTRNGFFAILFPCRLAAAFVARPAILG